ncbi:MAG: gluconokinase [Geminicoccaceae bacterium]|nr:gluconokinase [Geminicoccaceae bacterium]
MADPHIIVVMGVTSSGKSSIGRALADRLGAAFFEGDDFHPRANVEKMSRGQPLDDADRAPWLDAIATEIERQARTGRSAIFTCSALRRIYRDRLRRGSGYLRFVFLDGERELIAGRMAARRDHFMPPTLLPSQLATLERPDGEADVLQVDNSAGIGEIVEQIAAILAAG